MKTKSKPRYLNLTAAQARHLHETGSLLVVIPLKNQPVQEGRCGDSPMLHWVNRSGIAVSSEAAYVIERIVDEAPLGKPGDVVLCREPWALSVFDPEGGSPADDPENWDVVYDDGGPQNWRREEIVDGYAVSHPIDPPWRPAWKMPQRFIRLRPVIATVECRRVSDITNEEAAVASFPKHDGSVRIGCTERAEFACNWHRRYRGPEYAFERAWGFFYTLTKE